MNEKKSFHYGDSREWFSLLETYSTVGIVLMVWVLVISSNVVNRERKQNMLEVLSSCSRGGSALFLSKLAAVITCALIGLLLMILPVTLYAWLSGNLGDMAVNITEGLHMISVFTYQEGFLISMEVLVLGAMVCAILGTLASTCLKSSYVSLGLCMLCMLAGTALSSYASWMKLFPFKFMELLHVSQSEASPAICLIRPFSSGSCFLLYGFPAVFCFAMQPYASIAPALITEFRSYKA